MNTSQTINLVVNVQTAARAYGYKGLQIVYKLPVVEAVIPKFKSALKDINVSNKDKNFLYKSPEIVTTGDEEFKLDVQGYSKLDCGCVVVKTLGSKGFKIQIATSKITKKDVGEHILKFDLQLIGNDFKKESQSFKLTISYKEEKVVVDK